MESSSATARVAELKRAETAGRLLKGATNLGETWRAGQRCLSEFSRICPCANPTDFCMVKLKWVKIAEEHYGGPPFGLSGNEGYYVILAMTASQLRATRFTVAVQIPTGPASGQDIWIGPRGTSWKTFLDLADLQDDDAALAVGLDAVVKLQKADRR